jgi:NAD-dependent DNA ligase
MDREIPIWMILLLILFGIGAVASFGSFVFFHAKSSSFHEELQRQDLQKDILIDQKTHLQKMVVAMDEPIKLRVAKLDTIEANIKQSLEDIATFGHEQKNLVAETKEALKTQERKYEAALLLCKKNRGNLANEEKTTYANEMRADEDRRELRAQVEALSREIEGIKRHNRDELKVLEDGIAGLTERVQELKDRIDITRNDLVSDGQLLEARADSGFVIINRGINNNLRKGTLFTVYNRRGGKNIPKGKIEVREVQPLSAECRVLEEVDANDPMIPGDHIHNAIYNPDEVKLFVIKGDFITYNATELRRFIQDVGGQVDDDLSIRSHYLVAGSGPEADAAIKTATTLGVIILSEDKLIEFVHSPVRFQVRQGMVFAIRGDFGADMDINDIRRFILDNGGVIADEVDHRVNVLIAGDNCADDVVKARTTGITVLHKSQLMHLSGNARRQ